MRPCNAETAGTSKSKDTESLKDSSSAATATQCSSQLSFGEYLAMARRLSLRRDGNWAVKFLKKGEMRQEDQAVNGASATEPGTKTRVSKILKGGIPSLLCTQSGEGRRGCRCGGKERGPVGGKRGCDSSAARTTTTPTPPPGRQLSHLAPYPRRSLRRFD